MEGRGREGSSWEGEGLGGEGWGGEGGNKRKSETLKFLIILTL